MLTLRVDRFLPVDNLVGGAEDAPLLDAAREEFVRHGFRRAAVGDIAQRAGVSRMTLHRRLGDKEAIMQAVLAREVVDFFSRAVRFANVESPGERIVEVVVAGVVELRQNDLAIAALEYDAEGFLPLLKAGPGSEFERIRDFAALALAGAGLSGDLARQVTEIALRLTATLLVAPSELIPLQTAEDARRFATAFLKPLVDAAHQAQR